MFVDELGHDGDGHGCRRGGQDVLDLSILHINKQYYHILSGQFIRYATLFTKLDRFYRQ